MRLQKKIALLEKGRWMKFTVVLFFVKFILKIASKFRMFFSERGKGVPFTIHNTAERDEHGHELVRWNRTFYFHNKKKVF